MHHAERSNQVHLPAAVVFVHQWTTGVTLACVSTATISTSADLFLAIVVAVDLSATSWHDVQGGLFQNRADVTLERGGTPAGYEGERKQPWSIFTSRA